MGYVARFTYILISLLLTHQAVAENRVNDSTGAAVVLNHPATRIISLAPNLSEIVFEVGAGRQIVARDKYSDYPLPILKVPALSDYFHMNVEQILYLKPDLILVEDSSFLNKDIKKLRARGIAVYVNKATSLNSITKTMIDVGILTNHETIARQKARYLQGKEQQLIKRYANSRPITVFYELWGNPLLTVNRYTLINEVLEGCGGRNIFASLKASAPRVSVESVICHRPKVILSSLPNFQVKWRQVPEIKQSNLFFIAPSIIERTGPRLLQGMEKICAILQQVRQADG